MRLNMENKANFNKNRFATMILQSFIATYINGHNVANAYDRIFAQIDNDKNVDNAKNNEERRKILEKCRDLFKDTSLKKRVDLEIERFRNHILSTKGRVPNNEEVAKRILECFSDVIWCNAKRTYNMSNIATNGMISTKKMTNGSTEKEVWFESFKMEQQKHGNNNPKAVVPSVTLKNSRGNSIIIEYMGALHYNTLSSNEYIYKHRIYKSHGTSSYRVYEKFSNIDINALEKDSELRKIVFSELLSDDNLELSSADDYIGEIAYSKSSLQPGEELLTPSHYTYQITPTRALIYDGERIEAIRAYKQQELLHKKNEKEQNDEPELS